MSCQNTTTYEILVSAGYEFVSAVPTGDGRFEIVMIKDDRVITLITSEPFPIGSKL